MHKQLQTHTAESEKHTPSQRVYTHTLTSTHHSQDTWRSCAWSTWRNRDISQTTIGSGIKNMLWKYIFRHIIDPFFCVGVFLSSQQWVSNGCLTCYVQLDFVCSCNIYMYLEQWLWFGVYMMLSSKPLSIWTFALRVIFFYFQDPIANLLKAPQTRLDDLHRHHETLQLVRR